VRRGARTPTVYRSTGDFPTRATCDTLQNMNTQNTQDTEYRNIAVRVDADLYALIKSAAHRREMSIATFVRETLRQAAEHYVQT